MPELYRQRITNGTPAADGTPILVREYLIAMFPLSLLPVFAIPMSILLHLASLQKLRQEQRTGYKRSNKSPHPAIASSVKGIWVKKRWNDGAQHEYEAGYACRPY